MVPVVVVHVISQLGMHSTYMFWMLNTIGWVTFYWHWKHMAIWGGNQVNLMNHQIILWAGYVITYG
jgi:hypothetical protein